MKAIFLIGGPGSGKNVIMQEVLNVYSFKEYDSKQIRQAKLVNENIIVVTGNAYDVDSIAFDKLVVETHGYETYAIFVDVSEQVCKDRTSFLSEDIRENRYSNSKSNIEVLNTMFENNFILFNNDIDKDHKGFISKSIRLEEIAKVTNDISIFLQENKKPSISKNYSNLIESSTNRMRSKLQEYCPSCSLTKVEFNPEKKGILYDEDADEHTYGNVTLTKSKPSTTNRFQKDKETDKKNNNPSIKNTTSQGVGDQYDTRGSGTVYPMSGLGSVTYRESKYFSKLLKTMREAIDSPSVDGDMAVTGGEYGPSNKEPLVTLGDNSRAAGITITKQKKKK